MLWFVLFSRPRPFLLPLPASAAAPAVSALVFVPAAAVGEVYDGVRADRLGAPERTRLRPGRVPAVAVAAPLRGKREGRGGRETARGGHRRRHLGSVFVLDADGVEAVSLFVVVVLLLLLVLAFSSSFSSILWLGFLYDSGLLLRRWQQASQRSLATVISAERFTLAI